MESDEQYREGRHQQELQRLHDWREADVAALIKEGADVRTTPAVATDVRPEVGSTEGYAVINGADRYVYCLVDTPEEAKEIASDYIRNFETALGTVDVVLASEVPSESVDRYRVREAKIEARRAELERGYEDYGMQCPGMEMAPDTPSPGDGGIER